MLSVAVEKKLRDFPLSLAFDIQPGETLVFIGPSGCGKTTTLNLLSGLLKPECGRIILEDRVLYDSTKHTNIPVEKRNIGYVFQDFALFPHMTVAENIAYGLHCRRTGKDEVKYRVAWSLEMVGLAAKATIKTTQLSGGEKQRVALARAISLNSPLLLLDEPLGSLDAQTRMSVRNELRTVLKRVGCMTIMVTHDHVDALTFGDRICVLDRGQILQIGDKRQLLTRPRSKFVADLVGANFYEGTISSQRSQGLAAVQIGHDTLYAATEEMGDTMVSFYPTDVTISLAPPAGSAVNVFESVVKEIVHFGDRVRLGLNSSLPMVAEISAESLDSLCLQDGSRVYASLKATAIKTYR
jgi:molybdate transport system ATP-binding protein